MQEVVGWDNVSVHWAGLAVFIIAVDSGWMVKVGVECFVNHMILARTRCQINIIIIERMKLKASEYKIGTNRVTFIATLKLHGNRGSSFDCLCHRIELKDGQVD